MTASLRQVFALASSLSLASPALAGEVIVPIHAPTTAGNGGYTTLMHAQERSYQLVVGPQELGGMPVGSRITGITWRRPSWIVYSDWPGVGNSASFAAFDVSLSTSNNPPGSLSTTYTDNIGPDVVQVRSGPLNLKDAFFPGGALTPAVNPLGTVVPFTTPYVYKGGDLLLTIRHTGNGVNSGALDTLSSPYYEAIGVSSYTQATGWYKQGLITMKLVFDGAGATYCTAKTNSLGCVPAIAGSGAPSASATSGFTIDCAQVRNSKAGLLFYTVNGAQNAGVFQCGTLCVGPAGIKRTPAQSSGGNPAPANDCSGSYSLDMNAFGAGLAGGNPDPALGVGGTQVHAQYWGRDQGFAAPCNTMLSDGVEYTIAP